MRNQDYNYMLQIQISAPISKLLLVPDADATKYIQKYILAVTLKGKDSYEFINPSNDLPLSSHVRLYDANDSTGCKIDIEYRISSS